MVKLLIAMYVALLLCPFIAILITIPFVVGQYRKTKLINVIRCARFYLMIFFTLTAFFLTLLPFPAMEEVAAMDDKYLQLIPFYCIYSYFKFSGVVVSDWSTILPSFFNIYFYGVISNMIMLLPTGYCMRRVFKIDMKKVVLICFGISLFFELTQLSALFGYYPRPYRMFDVDDLIQNTLGGYLGALLAVRVEKKEEPRVLIVRQGGEVSFIRRLLSDIVDQGLLLAMVIIAMIFLKNTTNVYESTAKVWLIYFLLIFLGNILLGLFTYIFKGKDLGTFMMGLRLRDRNGEKLSLVQCFLRAVLYSIYINIPILMGVFINVSFVAPFPINTLCVLVSATLAGIYVMLMLSLLLHIVTHGEQLIYEKVSNTHLGLEVRRVTKGQQQVLLREKLSADKIDSATESIMDILKKNEHNEKTCLKMKYMADGVLVSWMENGLAGNDFTVQVDKRFARKILLICVPGDYVPIVHEENEDNQLDMLTDVLSGTRLSYDTYYTGGVNIFAIEL